MVVDARVANEGDAWASSGANPSHLDDETESILFLSNSSDRPAPIGFSVTAQGVHYYLTKLLLNPHETRAIDIRKLRDAQEEDFEGNTIPVGATDGSVNWIRLDNVAVSGQRGVLRPRRLPEHPTLLVLRDDLDGIRAPNLPSAVCTPFQDGFLARRSELQGFCLDVDQQIHALVTVDILQ